MLHTPKTRTRTQRHHLAVLMRQDGITRVSQPRPYFPDTAFLETFSAPALPPMRNIFADTALHMPPEPYDHVVAGATGAAQFLASDQCVGCHAAGATGLRFDMTVQTRPGGLLVNLAPYGEWRASPMGLAGRDPIFFSQLETERTVHVPQEKVIQDLCLHCHGVMGQRQFCMEQLGKDSQHCSNTGLLDRACPLCTPVQANRIEQTDGTRRGMVGATRALFEEHTIMAQQPRPCRCPWVDLAKADYVAYHDQEWGVPVYDDRRLFEFLVLESAQAGLSWYTVLRKRDNYCRAFADFDPERVAQYTESHIATLLQNPGIIRNRQKVHAAITNAQRFLDVQAAFGSFAAYIWRFVDHTPMVHTLRTLQDYPATSPESDALSKDLRQRGFKFVGSTICYAHMQATGMVNDHTIDCFRRQQIIDGYTKVVSPWQ